jgi:hypothetical protein
LDHGKQVFARNEALDSVIGTLEHGASTGAADVLFG